MSKNKTYYEETPTSVEGGVDETGVAAMNTTADAEMSIVPEAAAPQEGKSAPDVEAAQEAEQTIYVGPNVLPLALRRFQVFRGGLPSYVERAIEKIPEVRQLIVPVSELNEASTKTAKPGTNEFRLYEAVKKAAEGVK